MQYKDPAPAENKGEDVKKPEDAGKKTTEDATKKTPEDPVAKKKKTDAEEAQRMIEADAAAKKAEEKRQE